MTITKQAPEPNRRKQVWIAIGLFALLWLIYRSDAQREEPQSVAPRDADNRPVVSADVAPPTNPSAASSSTPDNLSPEARRRELATNYLGLIERANPHLNFIKQKTTKIKGGYALWLVHSGFTQSSFDFGDDAKIVQTWIDRNSSDLKYAGIVRVGLQNASGYLGSCFFDLK